MHLNKQQIQHFEEEGYLVVKNALTDADLDPVIAEYCRDTDQKARQLYAAGKLSNLYQDQPFERRLASITAETTAIYQDVDIMHFRGEASFNFLRNDNLLDPIESLVGPRDYLQPHPAHPG